MFKCSVYNQEKGIVNIKYINSQKICIGIELLLHVAQTDNDVKKKVLVKYLFIKFVFILTIYSQGVIL